MKLAMNTGVLGRVEIYFLIYIKLSDFYLYLSPLLGNLIINLKPNAYGQSSTGRNEQKFEL